MASGKIMIVDDDRNICELLRLYIEKEGFETAIANDGKAAVQMFDSVNPDLMLLDIMLPELDGWQVCREIRIKSQCPIIMLTAKGEVFSRMSCGFVCVMMMESPLSSQISRMICGSMSPNAETCKVL